MLIAFSPARDATMKIYKQLADKLASRGFIKNRVSIDERPKIVDDKGRIGAWEIDLVIGKGHSGALVTIVERKLTVPYSQSQRMMVNNLHIMSRWPKT